MVLFFSLLNGISISQSSQSDLSTNNEGTDLKKVSQKLQNKNLIMMKMTTDTGTNFLETYKSNVHVSNASCAESPFTQDKKRILKRSVDRPTNERPPLFLLALEEVNTHGCREKREIPKKVIPLRLYAVEKNEIRKRSLVNDSVVDKVIDKYFPKIMEQPPVKFKYKKNRREAHTSPKLRRNIRHFIHDDYHLSSEPLSIDELNVITEANRTLGHISKLTECDSFEMPEAMKKPLVAVLFKRISNIYSDKNKIKKQ